MARLLVKRDLEPNGKVYAVVKTLIEDNIEPSSTIITDGSPSYNELSTKGYKNKVQMPKLSDSEEEVLPNVHRIASLLKKMVAWHTSELCE